MKHKSNNTAAAIPIFALVLLASNLRPALTSVGPLLEEIRQGVGISVTAAGLLNSLPLLAFACFSPLAQLGRRFGLERTLVVSMLALTTGLLLRSQGSVIALFGGTIMLAAGIAIANVLIPGVIKRDYANRVQSTTTLYAMALGLTSAIASGLAVPLSNWLPGGWRAALAAWSIFSVVALIVWLPPAWRTPGEKNIVRVPRTSVWRSSLAWKITAFMGLQSMTFYMTIGWFPAILQDMGYSAENAGFLITLFQLISLVVGISIPPLLRLASDQKLFVFFASLLISAALMGMILMPGIAYLWVLLMGLGSGVCFVLALAFIGLRASDHYRAASLSVMTQSIGYLVAAMGPLAFGFLHDFAHNWTVPLIAMVVVTLVQALFGLAAGRNRTV
ncbi:MFS transporter, CP family, cyanate transporter [Beijerinckia sp. 28-YEA-48]|nr:MFS transporter, CP family, cyanate transporter [Beijerinckia sp. 28-YEA-48]